MGIIWLIIKIILWTLLVGVTIIISICMLVLLAPIRYEAYLEKYDTLNYEVKVNYLVGVRGHFYLQDGKQSSTISVFGKQVYSFSKEEDVQEKIDKEQSKIVTLDTGHRGREVKEASQCQVINKERQNHQKNKSRTQDSYLADEHDVIDKVVSIPTRLEEGSDGQDFKSNHGNITSLLKKMVAIPQFLSILKCTFKLVKEIITYIGPKEWTFELIIGREEPADTGELIAKLIMLYPWYYQHGVIQGNYETSGVWGGFLAQGKFSVGGILKRFIRFLWYRPIRRLIKFILGERKEEKDGK